MIIYNAHENFHTRICMFTVQGSEEKKAYIFTYAHYKKCSKHAYILLNIVSKCFFFYVWWLSVVSKSTKSASAVINVDNILHTILVDYVTLHPAVW